MYGGSVKPDNVDALMAQPDIDGMLVAVRAWKWLPFNASSNIEVLEKRIS